MKLKAIIIYLAGLLLITSCTSAPEPTNDTVGEINFALNGSTITRVAKENISIKSVDLLICNEQHHILQRVPAQLTNNGSNLHYTAKGVERSNSKRYVHFIINYNNWDNNDNAIIGKDARGFLSALTSEHFAAWRRITLDQGINTANPFGDEPIEVIPNLARFTVNVKNGLTNVTFAVHNLDRGTIAQFDPKQNDFVEGVTTVPGKAKMVKPIQFVQAGSPNNGAQSESYYTFERDYKGIDSEYSSVIIKGDYQGLTYYYKIDLVDHNGKRHAIKRNHSYHIEIQSVSGKGATTLEDAIEHAANNTNFSLDEHLELFPSISNRQQKLVVDDPWLLFTHEQTVSFPVHYYYTDDNNQWLESNLYYMPPEIVEVDGYETSIRSVNLNSYNSTVTVQTQSVGRDPKFAKIKIGVDHNGKKIYRFVRVSLRRPYTFEQIKTTKGYGQNSNQTITLQLPKDFPSKFLPIQLMFATEDYYPNNRNPMLFSRESGRSCYTYTLPAYHVPGTPITLEFRCNKSQSNERLTLTSPFFNQLDFAFSNSY